MIKLFDIPNYVINTGQFSNLLHDPIVRQFEEKFCEYVGARYGCSLHSATNALFLLFSALKPTDEIQVPSIIPTVVPNALINAGCSIRFVDNVDWVGDSYILYRFHDTCKVIDSAQKVKPKQFAREADDGDLMIFSFYPTKPVGSSDGCMVVSNNEGIIQFLREYSFNGTSFADNNWERKVNHVGHKMYMNSISAYIAYENLKLLDEKLQKLAYIRTTFNTVFGYKNTSDHLYRINVLNNKQFLQEARDAGIVAGIHYPAAHRIEIYKANLKVNNEDEELPLSDFVEAHSVSLPFHENLSQKDIEKIIAFTLPYIEHA